MKKQSQVHRFGLIIVFLIVIVTGISWYDAIIEEMEIVDQGESLEVAQMELEYGSQTLFLPAVDEEGAGVLASLVVEVESGSGKELINIDKLVFWEDTQQSIQTAKQVAVDQTGIDSNSIDVIYSITADGSTVVGGPSAGAALTIATLAAIENLDLDETVIITGTINPDGTIGQVGGIPEKALAAEQGGAQLFLIPQGEATHSYIEPVRKCEEYPDYTYCETVYEKTEVFVGEDLEIDIREVSTVQQAIKYFLVEQA